MATQMVTVVVEVYDPTTGAHVSAWRYPNVALSAWHEDTAHDASMRCLRDARSITPDHLACSVYSIEEVAS